METGAQGLVLETRRIILIQLLIGLVVAAGFYLVQGPWEALSALYGGAISAVSALLLRWGIVQAGGAVQQGEKKKGEVILYAGAAVRFVLILILFGIGLAIVKLSPLATVAGFITVQLVFLLAARAMKQRQG